MAATDLRVGTGSGLQADSTIVRAPSGALTASAARLDSGLPPENAGYPLARRDEMAHRILSDSEARRAFLLSMTALADGAQPGPGRSVASHPVITVVSLAVGLFIATAFR